MTHKFNTVLIPPSHIAKSAIEFAQKHFSNNHMGYCLGSDGHLPHITLAQTTISEQEVAKILHDQILGVGWPSLEVLNFTKLLSPH